MFCFDWKDLAPVNKLDGLLQSVDSKDTEDRSEYLVLVGLHVLVHVADDGRSNKVTVGVLGNLTAVMTPAASSSLSPTLTVLPSRRMEAPCSSADCISWWILSLD